MRTAIVISGQMRDYKVNAHNHIQNIIAPNDADVFVFACSKNTVHTTGPNITQKYNITSHESASDMKKSIVNTYGKYLKKIIINENENLDDSDFGTLGYFKRKMNNQMTNIREGFLMTQKYSKDNNFKYDFIVRLRPDNSMLPEVVNLSNYDSSPGLIHSTIYPSGHRDPWFFSFSDPDTFDKYCSFIYMSGCDESRTDNAFDCPELALEKYINSLGYSVLLHRSICRPFYQYDKTVPITDFPYRNKSEKLLDKNGNWVEQVL